MQIARGKSVAHVSSLKKCTRVKLLHLFSRLVLQGPLVLFGQLALAASPPHSAERLRLSGGLFFF
jgi:hypothetical protein